MMRIITKKIDGINYNIVYEFPRGLKDSPICPECGLKLADVADEPGFRCENEDCENFMMQICSVDAFINDPEYDELIEEFEKDGKHKYDSPLANASEEEIKLFEKKTGCKYIGPRKGREEGK